MKKVSFDSWGGDSGGTIFEQNSPVSATTKLLGSHVHSEDGAYPAADRGWYSTVEKAIDRMANQGVNITPCVTTSCGY